MRRSRPLTRYACAVLSFLFCTSGFAPAQQTFEKSAGFPYPEKLSYRIEWRLITAGTATVEMSHGIPADWQTTINLESEGLVTRLYKILDSYRVTSNDKFCGTNSVLDAEEGKRHSITHLSFENARHKVDYDERDLLKNSTVKKELDIAPCTYDIAGALEVLRQMSLQPHKWATLPMTDGKKMAYAKVEAQARESVSVEGKSYQSIRYELFIFDNVLYKRKGRMLIWISDDADRLPVQFRLQMGFPIGSVTAQLEKHQRM